MVGARRCRHRRSAPEVLGHPFFGVRIGGDERHSPTTNRTRWNRSLADYFGYRCCDSLGQELLRARKDRFGETPKRLSGSVRNARLTLVCTP